MTSRWWSGPVLGRRAASVNVPPARRPIFLVLTVALALSACQGDGGGDTGTGTVAAEGSALDLASVCPETIVLQKDWQPESEHGAWYNLVGDGYEVDTQAKSVTGPLVAQGQDTGVQLQIRSGGPAVGFQPVPAVMYTDPEIDLGFVATDEQVQFSREQPMLGVVAPLEISPMAIHWDRETYPEFDSIADIGQSDAKVLYTQGLAYMDYLTGSGQLREDQLDGSYDGSPAAFVAAGGRAAVQGFATSEPYIYEEQVEAWGKPLDFQLLDDTGYPSYFNAVAIRPDDREQLAPCLEVLVPIVQQSQIDFMENPDHAIEIILDAVEQYNTGWVYTEGLARFTHEQLTELGIVGNGKDNTLGNFEEERVQRIIDIVAPIFARQHKEIQEGITPADVFTNEFIDESIGYSPP